MQGCMSTNHFSSGSAQHLVRTLAEDDPQRLVVRWPVVAKPPRMRLNLASCGIEFKFAANNFGIMQGQVRSGLLYSCHTIHGTHSRSAPQFTAPIHKP